MVKRKKLKPALAMLLAVAMVLTGPAQSAGLVRVEEPVAQEHTEASNMERESTDKDESQTVQTQYTISVVRKIGEEKTKATKLTFTVTDKEPEVKLSAKGSIIGICQALHIQQQSKIQMPV